MLVEPLDWKLYLKSAHAVELPGLASLCSIAWTFIVVVLFFKRVKCEFSNYSKILCYRCKVHASALKSTVQETVEQCGFGTCRSGVIEVKRSTGWIEVLQPSRFTRGSRMEDYNTVCPKVRGFSHHSRGGGEIWRPRLGGKVTLSWDLINGSHLNNRQ